MTIQCGLFSHMGPATIRTEDWGEVVTTVSSYCQSNLCQKGMEDLGPSSGLLSTVAESDLPHLSGQHKFSFDFNKTAQIQNQHGSILQK